MSINITSTSDPLVTDGPTSSSTPATAQEEGTQKYQGVSALMSAVPDPAVIAKLANEFFAALPGAPVPPNAPSSLSPPQAGAIPAAPGAAVPDYPRGMFSFPAAPNAPQPTSPQPPRQPALSEADFRAIAASLAGELPLAPQVTTAAPPAAIPLSASSADAGSGGPWAAAPQIPPAAEMYSFPGVPAVPASPTAGPPSGSDAGRSSIFAVREHCCRQNRSMGRRPPLRGSQRRIFISSRARRIGPRRSRGAGVAA
jgi:hypothetical protein